jgi:hypothetical protein
MENNMADNKSKPTGGQLAFLEMTGRMSNFPSKQDAISFFNAFWDSCSDEDKAFWDDMASMFTLEDPEEWEGRMIPNRKKTPHNCSELAENARMGIL